MGTTSEQESLIWRQFLIKNLAKHGEASNYHRKTINCMVSSLRPAFFQGLLHVCGTKTIFKCKLYVSTVYSSINFYSVKEAIIKNVQPDMLRHRAKLRVGAAV